MKKFLYAVIAASVATLSFASAEDKAPKPVNATCPISGEAIDPDHVVTYTKVVGVCCEKCEAKLKEIPGGNLDKVAKVESKVVNSKCPLSGEEVDSAVTASYKGAKVGFCCEKCQGKFDADKDGSKVVMDVAGNEKCPFSGKDIDTAHTTVVRFPVALCCGKCEKKLAAKPDKYIEKVEFAKAE